jgi:hypothetical protein
LLHSWAKVPRMDLAEFSHSLENEGQETSWSKSRDWRHYQNSFNTFPLILSLSKTTKYWTFEYWEMLDKHMKSGNREHQFRKMETVNSESKIIHCWSAASYWEV